MGVAVRTMSVAMTVAVSMAVMAGAMVRRAVVATVAVAVTPMMRGVAVLGRRGRGRYKGGVRWRQHATIRVHLHLLYLINK